MPARFLFSTPPSSGAKKVSVKPSPLGRVARGVLFPRVGLSRRPKRRFSVSCRSLRLFIRGALGELRATKITAVHRPLQH